MQPSDLEIFVKHSGYIKDCGYPMRNKLYFYQALSPKTILANFKGLEKVLNEFIRENFKAIHQKNEHDYPEHAVLSSRRFYYNYINSKPIDYLTAVKLVPRIQFLENKHDR